MKPSILGVGLCAWAVAGSASAAAVPALKPVPSYDYNNPAGDPNPKYGSPIERNVVKASIGSDGSNIVLSATLKEDEHGQRPAPSSTCTSTPTATRPRAAGRIGARTPSPPRPATSTAPS